MKGYFDFGLKCIRTFSSPKASLIEHKKVLFEDIKRSGSLLYRASSIFSFNSTHLLENFSFFAQQYLLIHLSYYCYGKHLKVIGDE